MKEVLNFNTGREYTSVGQPIFCEMDEDRRVIFWDAARGISGVMQLMQPEEFEVGGAIMKLEGDNLTETNVMREYDAGRYEWHRDAMEFRKGKLLEVTNNQPQTDISKWSI